MRHINRTINISQYKSFMQSLLPAYNDGILVDMKQNKNKVKYNSSSNFSMMPSSCSVIWNNNDALIWAWDTLHRIYLFCKKTSKEDICVDSYLDYEYYYTALKISFEEWYDNYTDIQHTIIDFVEKGSDITNTKLQLKSLDTDINDYCNTDLGETVIAIPLHITNNIDNLGQETNLLEEWQPKTTYNVGNIVSYDNDAWRLVKNSDENSDDEIYANGYTWNETYKESVFGNLTFDKDINSYIPKSDKGKRQWQRNIEFNMAQPNEAFNYVAQPFKEGSQNINYAYKNNILVNSPSAEKMADIYPITAIGNKFIIYNNVVVEIKDYECVLDFNCVPGNTIVYFDCGKPYINYLGRNIYGFSNKSKTHYTFEFNGMLYTSVTKYGYIINGDFKNIDKTLNFIRIGNDSYEYEICSSNCSVVEIDNRFYITENNSLKSYVLDDDELKFNKEEIDTFGENLLSLENADKDSFGYVIYNNNIYLIMPYQEYSLNIVSGTCASHISMFKENEVLYDDLGSSVEALFIVNPDDSDKYNGVIRPLPNDSLSLIYKEGTVRNLTFVSFDENTKDNIYWGNILHTINFQILSDDGKILHLISDDELSGSTGNQLHNIYSNTVLKYENDELIWTEQGEDDSTFEESLKQVNGTLQCEIKYNIGCFIKKDEKGNYSLIEDLYQGIEYTDVYSIDRKIFMYGRSINDRYPIFYYTLQGEYIGNDIKTNFAMEIPIHKLQGSKSVLYDDTHFGTENDLKYDEYHGFITAPTFRQEYNIGTAFQEKVFGDIYIDRGISSAFEKHLKLQEVVTFQDLENYSNGGFFSITQG